MKPQKTFKRKKKKKEQKRREKIKRMKKIRKTKRIKTIMRILTMKRALKRLVYLYVKNSGLDSASTRDLTNRMSEIYVINAKPVKGSRSKI